MLPCIALAIIALILVAFVGGFIGFSVAGICAGTALVVMPEWNKRRTN